MTLSLSATIPASSITMQLTSSTTNLLSILSARYDPSTRLINLILSLTFVCHCIVTKLRLASVCLFVYLSACMFLCLFACVYVCPSV